MTKNLLRFFFCVMLLCLFVSVANSEQPAEGVFAKIGTVVVTVRDVQEETQRRIPLQASYHGGVKPEKIEKIKREVEETLVVRAYKLQYAYDNDIKIDDEEYADEWKTELVNKYKNKKMTNQQELSAKSDFYLSKLAEKAERLAVNQRVIISEEDVKSYYEQNKAQFLMPKTYKASHIFVKVDPSETLDQKDAKRKKAEKLAERARNGEDFYNLAYYESDDRTKYVGGSLGTFHAGRTVKEFDDALKTMKAGEVSGPVRTLYGFHIIKLDSVSEPLQMSYDEASKIIRNQLYESKRKQYYDEWISGLRQKYPVIK